MSFQSRKSSNIKNYVSLSIILHGFPVYSTFQSPSNVVLDKSTYYTERCFFILCRLYFSIISRVWHRMPIIHLCLFLLHYEEYPYCVTNLNMALIRQDRVICHQGQSNQDDGLRLSESQMEIWIYVFLARSAAIKQLDDTFSGLSRNVPTDVTGMDGKETRYIYLVFKGKRCKTWRYNVCNASLPGPSGLWRRG